MIVRVTELQSYGPLEHSVPKRQRKEAQICTDAEMQDLPVGPTSNCLGEC